MFARQLEKEKENGPKSNEAGIRVRHNNIINLAIRIRDWNLSGHKWSEEVEAAASRGKKEFVLRRDMNQPRCAVKIPFLVQPLTKLDEINMNAA